MLFGVDPRYLLRVSDPIEAGIIDAAIAEAARLQNIKDDNLAVAIIKRLAEAM